MQYHFLHGRDDEAQDRPPLRCLAARERSPGHRSPSHLLRRPISSLLPHAMPLLLRLPSIPSLLRSDHPPAPGPLSLPLSPPLLPLRRQPRPPSGAAPEALHPLLRRRLHLLDRRRVRRRLRRARRRLRRAHQRRGARRDADTPSGASAPAAT
ncbi:hypothetical protein BT93_L2472 [Corymbia citriodora subsp. variegata]|uniref:Uncharacterized protein n=1 Tax=Corymbia citriodora subsp. variegata TaxID=360336 RepID=A0A8T0CNY2_CORYI|nr:hypothetical protein BT93_L2472 [Corymbia citriodora subsp. variegata]